MICAGKSHDTRLPQSELVYTAFRLCFFDVASDVDMQRQPWGSDDEDPDDLIGFLAWKVPFFQAVPPIIQLDLLAALWRKHSDDKLHEIYLAEAAVLYAILTDAGRIATEIWDYALPDFLTDGPLKIAADVSSDIEQVLAEQFDEFWDDEDFLLIEMSQDGVPFQRTPAGALLGLPDEWVDEMYEILGRAKPRPTMLDDLAGLLTEEERESHRFLLEPET